MQSKIINAEISFLRREMTCVFLFLSPLPINIHKNLINNYKISSLFFHGVTAILSLPVKIHEVPKNPQSI